MGLVDLLEYAASGNVKKVGKTLSSNPSLLNTKTSGNVNVFVVFLRQVYPNFLASFIDGTTVLHVAALHGRLDVVEFLLRCDGVQINDGTNVSSIS